MTITRRQYVAGCLAASAFPSLVMPRQEDDRPICLISAPTNLGLRPGPTGAIPGTWRTPDVLLDAGLAKALGALRLDHIERPAYDGHEQPGTRVRNGQSIRVFSLGLAEKVAASLKGGEFPVVLGGDCSVLMGSLLGLRWSGGRGLIHIDGHSDFFHPGNYDTT